MDMRQLQYFLALCEDMNYTRAAKRLYLTRQALRQSMAALEREVGEPLFTSVHNHLDLTARGRWLQYRAKPVVQSFEQLEQEIFASARPVRPLRLGVSVALVPDYLPALPHRLEQFKTLHPNLGLEVLFLPNDEVLSGAESGELELGLIMDMEPAAYRVSKTILRRDTFMLMFDSSHPLHSSSAIEVHQLKGERIALPGKRREPFSPLLSACQSAGFEPQYVDAHGFYEANYLVRNEGCISVTRTTHAPTSQFDPTYSVPLLGMPPLCASLLQGPQASGTFSALLREELRQSAAQE